MLYKYFIIVTTIFISYKAWASTSCRILILNGSLDIHQETIENNIIMHGFKQKEPLGQAVWELHSLDICACISR